jgi:hypothetical protein
MSIVALPPDLASGPAEINRLVEGLTMCRPSASHAVDAIVPWRHLPIKPQMR